MKTAEESENKALLEKFEEEDESGEVVSLPVWYKMTRIAVLCLIYLLIGANFEIFGPVVPELIIQTHSDYERMLMAVSMRGAGHFFGGVLGGVTVDRWFRYVDLQMAVLTFILTATGVWAAYLTSIVWMYVVLLIQGAVETIVHTAGRRMVFVIFLENSAAPLTGVELGYQLGSVFAPLIVAPFLDKRFSGLYYSLSTFSKANNNKHNHEYHETLKSSSLNATYENVTWIEPHYPANFVEAFWILAGFGILLCIACVAFHAYGVITGTRLDKNLKVQTKQTFRESLSLRNCSQDHPYYALAMLVLLFLLIGCILSVGRVYAKVIFSYTRDGPGFSVHQASVINSAFFIASTAGGLIFILPLMLVHVKYVLQATTLMMTSVALYYLYTNITWLWILYVCVGLHIGATLSAGFSMANRYIELTSMAQMAPHFGAGVGDVTLMCLVAWSYQKFGPYSIWSYLMVVSVVLFCVVCGMQIVGKLMGDRFEKKKTKTCLS